MQFKTVMDKKKYLEQIDKFYKGKLDSFKLIEAGTTPRVLLEAGAKPLPLIMKQSTLRKCIREPRGNRSAHQIERQFVEQLPDHLENPVLIINDKKRNSIALINDYKDKNGFNILIAILKEQNVSGNLVNEIKSIYGKEHMKEYLLKEEIRDGLKIVDNKKAKEMFRVIGLQLPKALTTLDYKITIHKNIPEVKTENRTKQGELTKKSDIAKDLRTNGYQPTKSLINAMRKLYGRAEDCHSLKDIHQLYQERNALDDPEAKELVQKIAEECREQEIEKLQIPPLEL